MKLLLDENLSRRIVPFIQDGYPDSTQVALIGMEQAHSSNAIDNGYVMTTKDADFYEMNLLYGSPPKIIWLKIGNQSKAATIKTLLNNYHVIERALFHDNNDHIEIL